MRSLGIGILFQDKDEERMDREADESADYCAIEAYELQVCANGGFQLVRHFRSVPRFDCAGAGLGVSN